MKLIGGVFVLMLSELAFGGMPRTIVITADKSIGSYMSPTKQSPYMNYSNDFSISASAGDYFGLTYCFFNSEHYYGRYSLGFPDGFYLDYPNSYTLGTGLGAFGRVGNKYTYLKVSYNVKINAYKYLKGVNFLNSDLKTELGFSKYAYLAYKRIIPQKLTYSEGVNKYWADAANNVFSIGFNVPIKPDEKIGEPLSRSQKWLLSAIGASILSSFVVWGVSK